MKRTHGISRSVVTILVAAALAVGIAACGGSSSSSSKTTTTASSGTKTASASRAALTACLKKYGVTLASGSFHRPGGAGTGTTPTGSAPTGTAPTGTAPTGTAPTRTAPAGGFAGGASSKDEKAFKACGAKFGTGRPGGSFTRSATTKPTTKVLDSYVACIRKNGYAAMPNPYSTSKSTPFPASVEANTEFKAANAKCETIITKAVKRPPEAAPDAGTSTTTSS